MLCIFICTLITTFILLAGISLFQCPSILNMGVDQENLSLVPLQKSDRHDLPEDYTIVPAVAVKKEK